MVAIAPWMGGFTYRTLFSAFVELIQLNTHSWKFILLMLNRWGA